MGGPFPIFLVICIIRIHWKSSSCDETTPLGFPWDQKKIREGGGAKLRGRNLFFLAPSEVLPETFSSKFLGPSDEGWSEYTLPGRGREGGAPPGVWLRETYLQWKKERCSPLYPKAPFLNIFSSKNRFLGEKESEIYKILHLFNWGPISTKHPGGTLG